MCKNPDGRWDLVGITIFGNGGCAHPNYPDVLTRISAYKDWIQDFINQKGGPN